MQNHWHRLETLRPLEVNPTTGLTADEVKRLHEKPALLSGLRN